MGVGVTMKEGKITVTGAQAANGADVDCGFIPAYVKVLDTDAVLDAVIKLERFAGMADLTSLETLRTATGESPVMTTSDGLSDFDEADVTQVSDGLTGTVSKTENSTLLTGSGTLFTTQVNVGDRIALAGEKLEVASITSDTVLNTTSPWRTTAGPVAAGVLSPGSEVSQDGFKGFSIPASFLVDTHVLYFIAYGTQFGEV